MTVLFLILMQFSIMLQAETPAERLVELERLEASKLGELAASHPDFLEIQCLLAQTRLDLGDVDLALDHSRRAVKLTRSSDYTPDLVAESYRIHAAALLQKEDYGELHSLLMRRADPEILRLVYAQLDLILQKATKEQKIAFLDVLKNGAKAPVTKLELLASKNEILVADLESTVLDDVNLTLVGDPARKFEFVHSITTHPLAAELASNYETLSVLYQKPVEFDHVQSKLALLRSRIEKDTEEAIKPAVVDLRTVTMLRLAKERREALARWMRENASESTVLSKRHFSQQFLRYYADYKVIATPATPDPSEFSVWFDGVRYPIVPFTLPPYVVRTFSVEEK